MIDSELLSRLTGKRSVLNCIRFWKRERGHLLSRSQRQVNLRVETRWKGRVVMMEEGEL